MVADACQIALPPTPAPSLHLAHAPLPPSHSGLVTQTIIVDAKMFASSQYLVHDGGVVSHRGVIRVHCCQTDDRGPCGEREGVAAS